MSKILCIMLFLAFAAYGQQQQRIAIMSTVDTQDSIDFSDLSYLTDKLRNIAGDILPKNRYGIMTQQSIVDRLGSKERMVKECKESTCLADLGRKISADYIAQGYAGRFSGKLTIKVELYSVGSGNLIGQIADASENIDGLLAVLEVKAPDMFRKMPGVSDDISDLESSVDYMLDYGKPYPANAETGIKSEGSSSGLPKWVAISLDVLGAGAIGFGIYQNSQIASHQKKYNDIPQGSPQSDFNSAYKKVENSQNMRNTGYIAGGVLLLGGVSIHIFF
jgi:hypothetical protein